jgi:glycosyltransferase involved in cell wall biosynthesis
VRLLAFTRSALTPEQEKWAGDRAVRTVQHARSRSAWNLLRSYLSQIPVSIERSKSGGMQDLVAKEAAEFDPEIVFVDGWLMAQYLPARYSGLKILHEHNAEYQLWERQAGMESGLRGILARREARRVRRYESSLLPWFDWVFAVSQEDRRALQEIGGDANRIRVLPNIPQAELLARALPVFADTEPVVLYFGTLSWQPNIEGLERFLAFAHRQIVKRVPSARLVVAGKGASSDLIRRVEQTPKAEFAGEVEEAEALYGIARVVVDASQTGGGTRLKILNALARGIPVVASTEAARGLDIVAGEHLVVARNEQMLVESVTSLLQDAARWRVLSENGRALVRARYMPEVAFRALDDVMARASRKG